MIGRNLLVVREDILEDLLSFSLLVVEKSEIILK
jgi:hypothetical protein